MSAKLDAKRNSDSTEASPAAYGPLKIGRYAEENGQNGNRQHAPDQNGLAAERIGS